MKLCRDCKWHEPSDNTDENNNFDKCKLLTEKDKVISRVDGKNRSAAPVYCEHERGENGRCLPHAAFFYPKHQQAAA